MNNILGKFVTAWLRPKEAMQAVKDEGDDASIKSSMIFVVVMGVLSGILTAVMGMIFPAPAFQGGAGALWVAALIVPVVSFIGSFVAAFILWGPIVFGILRGSLAQYKTSYRILAVLSAFSPVSALLSPIPAVGQYLAIAINVWAIIVMIMGVIIVAETPAVRTWVLLGLIFGGMFILSLVLRSAAQNQLTAGGGFPGLNAAGSAGLDTDELNAQLEALTEQAREAQN